MAVFEDQSMLETAVSGALMPLLSPVKEGIKMRSSFPSFRQKAATDSEHPYVAAPSTQNDAYNISLESINSATPVENGPLDLRPLELGVKNDTAPASDNPEEKTKPEPDGPLSNSGASALTESSAESQIPIASLAETGNISLTEQKAVLIKDGPLTMPISFLQLAAHEKGNLPKMAKAAGDAVGNVLNKLSNIAAPMVNVEVVVCGMQRYCYAHLFH